jgi:hypothetical protein
VFKGNRVLGRKGCVVVNFKEKKKVSVLGLVATNR